MKHKIFIISDGTGKTAEGALKSAIAQFHTDNVELIINSKITDVSYIEKIIEKAKSLNGFVVHTIVSEKLRNKILELGRLNEVVTIDLMGPLLAQLAERLSTTPSEVPGLFRKLNKSYFQRIEAMEFAFRHDDGQRIEELDNAEIILVGVSRTFKTPLSIYFAFKGWMVANVPIIEGIAPPEILFKVKDKKIFGLHSNARALTMLRSVRDKHLGGGTGNYADRGYVQNELDFALSVFKKLKDCRIINVTNKPIEEISSEILKILRKIDNRKPVSGEV